MDVVGGIVSALDVGIRLVFVYVILGLGTAAVQEAVAVLFRLRARNLRRALNDLLEDPELGADFPNKVLEHPLIRSRERGGMPSYVSASAFGVALLDALERIHRSSSPNTQAAQMSQMDLVQHLSNTSRVRRVFEALDAEAKASSHHFPHAMERWFYANMDGASATYRIQVLKRLFGIAIILTVLANVNTFRVLEALLVPAGPPGAAKSSDVRTTAASPIQYGARSLIGWGVEGRNSLVERLPAWTPTPARIFVGFLADYAVGWLLTSVMVTVTAVALFDLLNRVMQVKEVGRPPKEEMQPSPRPSS